MKTLANVYLLPHNNIDTKLTMYHDGNGNYKKLSSNLDKLQYHTNQHLYITLPQSDLEISKIKKGDWCYRKDIGIFQCKEKPSIPKSWGEKIIATTDTSLIIHSPLVDKNGLSVLKEMKLPSISQLFIEHFISEYNKGNVIENIEVVLDGDWDESYKGYYADTIRPKINQQNEISIVISEEVIEQQKWISGIDSYCEILRTLYDRRSWTGLKPGLRRVGGFNSTVF